MGFWNKAFKKLDKVLAKELIKRSDDYGIDNVLFMIDISTFSSP